MKNYGYSEQVCPESDLILLGTDNDGKRIAYHKGIDRVGVFTERMSAIGTKATSQLATTCPVLRVEQTCSGRNCSGCF